jgi:hypothetical protein
MAETAERGGVFSGSLNADGIRTQITHEAPWRIELDMPAA